MDIQAVIKHALEAHGLQDSSDKLDLDQFKTPVRIGEILDHIKAQTRKNQKQFHTLGPYTLNTHDHVLKDSANKTIKLTEKETALLALLAEHKKTISRKVILKEVWEYAEDTETHTLETHIYRLRQKIESDPGKPKILMTDEEGYFISS